MLKLSTQTALKNMEIAVNIHRASIEIIKTRAIVMHGCLLGNEKREMCEQLDEIRHALVDTVKRMQALTAMGDD